MGQSPVPVSMPVIWLCTSSICFNKTPKDLHYPSKNNRDTDSNLFRKHVDYWQKKGRDYSDDDVVGRGLVLGLLLPILGKNPQPAFYGLKLYHMTPIFFCLTSHVNYLIAQLLAQKALFLYHLSSLVYCFMPLVLRSHVYCLPSTLFCCMSAHFRLTKTAAVHIIMRLQPWL